ncbi:RICIN domain-containing protein [Kitasatospora sp. NPDC096077]|uniref:NHL domain-containing protein n=1 Tax=Kitasatospora sp. NPDC096077 TaxID=3155544 RepID=UPI0033203180
MTTPDRTTTPGQQTAPPITTVAGTGPAAFAGDNGPAVAAQLNRPLGLAADSAGMLHIADYNNQRIRRITTDGRIGTLAGTATAGYSGDNGPAALAQVNQARGLAVDSAGTLYIADAANHRIRRITKDGRITTFAGTGAAGFSGNGAAAASAQLNYPLAVAVDSTGAVYVSDYNNNRIRKIAADGRISTVAGTGAVGSGGDGGPADKAQLNYPRGLAVDATGTLYFADGGNHRIRKVTADGRISTVAGTGVAGFSGDGGPADKAQLNLPMGMAVDSTGAVYVADYNNHRVRRIGTDGRIGTVAGTGTAGFGGDNGPPVKAQLNNPAALAVDCVDTLYIADHVNNRIRRIASPLMAGLPESGTVVSWSNVRSGLRMGVLRESTKDGAEIHQSLAVPREHQRWRLVVAGRSGGGEVLYTFENLRSGKVLEIVDGEEAAGAVAAQRAYQGVDAHHQQWRLIPVGTAADSARTYEIANRRSGLLLRVDATAPAAVKQQESDGDQRNRQWQLLPV